MMSKQQKKYYPVFLDLSGKRCVVIGGGNVAVRKVKDLLDVGADVLVVSRESCAALASLTNKGRIKIIVGEYHAEHLKDAALIIGATDDSALNRRVAKDARKKRIPVNIVDVPDLCDFIVPAGIRRGALSIAVSTSGASPALAKKIRMELEETYGKEYAKLLDVLFQVRQAVLAHGLADVENKKVFTALVNSPLMETIKDDNARKAEEIVKKITGKTIKVRL